METIGGLKEEFPDKYLFADDLGGKKVTLTIAAMNADTLVTEGGKKRSVVVTFVGKKKVLVLNKTNAYLINEIFPLAPGASLRTWVGKRITLYSTQCKLRGETVDCIRIWGSPDLAADKKAMVKQGFSRVAMTLHAMKAGTDSATVPDEVVSKPAERPQEESVDPQVLEAWSLLGWTQPEGYQDLNDFRNAGGDVDADYMGHLNAEIDQMNAKEGAAF